MHKKIQKPYVLHIGDDPRPEKSKIAMGAITFIPEDCVGYIANPDSLSLPNINKLSIEDAIQKGAKSFVIGSVAKSGAVEQEWIPHIVNAIENGLDIINGHHQKLNALKTASGETLEDLSKKHGTTLHNIRHYEDTLPIGTGKPRKGKRLLTVGTDCSCGKMFTSLSLHAYLTKKNVKSRFAATGQSGILIAGEGVPIDAIVSDYMSGAIEQLTPESDALTIIEGQGSLFHPAYAGVSLGLLHGAQADYIILCHNPAKDSMLNVDYPIPDIADCLALNLKLGRRTNPNQKCVGISLNTSALSEDDAKSCIKKLETEFKVPVTDPYRFGIAPIADKLAEEL
jgi:uncharacterized NAD-dependent epimerase/dehydratase family protein